MQDLYNIHITPWKIMKIIKPMIHLSILLSLASSGVAEECTECVQSDLVKGECFEVKGELSIYDDFPPYLRIETESKDKVFAVGPDENEFVPATVKAVIPTSIEGTFVLCPFKQTTTVPFDSRIIEMVCIKSVKDAWYWDKETGEKKKLE